MKSPQQLLQCYFESLKVLSDLGFMWAFLASQTGRTNSVILLFQESFIKSLQHGCCVGFSPLPYVTPPVPNINEPKQSYHRHIPSVCGLQSVSMKTAGQGILGMCLGKNGLDQSRARMAQSACWHWSDAGCQLTALYRVSVTAYSWAPAVPRHLDSRPRLQEKKKRKTLLSTFVFLYSLAPQSRQGRRCSPRASERCLQDGSRRFTWELGSGPQMILQERPPRVHDTSSLRLPKAWFPFRFIWV